MKAVLSLFLFFVLLMPGCTITQTSRPTEENIFSLTSESVDLKKLLRLQGNQTCDVFDYQGDTALVLISDHSKQNPLDISDQTITTFYESFVLFDLSSKEAKKVLPIQRFGICPSALLAFEGVVFSFFEINPENGVTSSVQFIDVSGVKSIYTGNFSSFGMGPVLQRYDSGVLFSYLESVEFWEQKSNTFGVIKIGESFEAESILQFSSEDVDYISDDFKASETGYAYVIGDGGKVTFCAGTSKGTTTQISLPQGRKIHSFDVINETLIVSLAATDKNTPAGIQVFDLNTGDLILEQTDNMPSLNSICANECGQLCGFSFSPNAVKAPPPSLKVYSLTNQVEELTIDASVISGSFFNLFSNGKDFLAAIYGFSEEPKFWIISQGANR